MNPLDKKILIVTACIAVIALVLVIFVLTAIF